MASQVTQGAAVGCSGRTKLQLLAHVGCHLWMHSLRLRQHVRAQPFKWLLVDQGACKPWYLVPSHSHTAIRNCFGECSTAAGCWAAVLLAWLSKYSSEAARHVNHGQLCPDHHVYSCERSEHCQGCRITSVRVPQTVLPCGSCDSAKGSRPTAYC